MSDRDDSDAPEEFTAEEGVQLEQEIIKIQKDSTQRVKQEGKERRRKWANRKTPKPSQVSQLEKIVQDEQEEEPEDKQKHSNDFGMLSKDIVDILAKQEKLVFSSDSEDEDKKHKGKMKRVKQNGHNNIILNDLPPPPCLQNSLDFLKKRKMQVPRSNAVLNNSKQALRLISTSGLLK